MRSIAVCTLMLTMLCSAAVAPEATGMQGVVQQLMSPIVRVRTPQSAGSGTILFGQFVLTNYHVVARAITVDGTFQRWDSVCVELFSYGPRGHVDVRGVDAHVVACDPDQDLALLKLHCGDLNSAELLPEGTELELLKQVWVVGCALGDDPICTCGHIMDLDVQHDGKSYLLISAQVIYGNSGGAMFVQIGKYTYLAGVPSRVRLMGNGQALPYMAYAIPPERIWEFLVQCGVVAYRD